MGKKLFGEKKMFVIALAAAFSFTSAALLEPTGLGCGRGTGGQCKSNRAACCADDDCCSGYCYFLKTPLKLYPGSCKKQPFPGFDLGGSAQQIEELEAPASCRAAMQTCGKSIIPWATGGY